LFQQALAAVPQIERRGPLVTDDSGVPVRRRYYRDLYRDVADAAGVPRTVWSMHARHGGATEAQHAGASLADIAEHAQHDPQALHRAVSRDLAAHRQATGCASSGKGEHTVKMGFGTNRRKRA